MKKILASLFILSIVFVGCDKDITTEDTSTITNYVVFQLEGDELMTIPVGQAYAEPGYIAMEGENDVSGNVNVAGTVDGNTIGYYTLTYSAENVDGYAASTSRTVIVYDPAAPDTDISGTYDGSREDRGGGVVTIEKLAPGIFFVSDMFGGYYEFIAGYGSAYRLRTYVQLNADNTITSLSNNSPWGPWGVSSATYDPGTGNIIHRVNFGSFGFNVTLTKQ